VSGILPPYHYADHNTLPETPVASSKENFCRITSQLSFAIAQANAKKRDLSEPTISNLMR